MAIAYLGSNGFDNGELRVSDLDRLGFGVTTGYAHTGAYSAQGGSWIRYLVTGTPANCSVSVWLNLKNAYGNSGSTISFVLTDGKIVHIQWDATAHTFDAYVDGVKVADGTVEIAEDNWFHVQFYATIDNAGYIGVKMGGQLSIDYSGDTLPDGSSAEVEYIKIYLNTPDSPGYIDDLVWGTGGFLGDCRVEWLAPTADTAVENWTPSTGADSYAVVDEVPPNTTDYLYTSVNAQETELELADWDDTNKTPLAVTAWAKAYEDAATAESLKVGVDSGGVDNITEHIMTDQYQYYGHFMNENPDGPAAWDNAAIDALKHRIESVI